MLTTGRANFACTGAAFPGPRALAFDYGGPVTPSLGAGPECTRSARAIESYTSMAESDQYAVRYSVWRPALWTESVRAFAGDNT